MHQPQRSPHFSVVRRLTVICGVLVLAMLMAMPVAWAQTLPVSSQNAAARARAPRTVLVTPHTTSVAMTTSDQDLTPLNNTYEFYVDIPTTERVGAADWTVFFRHSPTLISSASNLVIAVDGIPYGTVLLGHTNAALGSLRVTIPASALTPGYHALSITVQLQSSLLACNVNTNTDWFVLLHSSRLQFPTINAAHLPNVALFPYPFYNAQHPDQWKTAIVTSTHPPAAVINGLYAVIQTLGDDADTTQLASHLVITPHPDRLIRGMSRSFIYVGMRQQLPKWLQKELPASTPAVAGDGLVAEVALAGGNEAGLIVTGNTAHAVEVAANSLKYPDLIQQMASSPTWITPALIAQAETHVAATHVANSTIPTRTTATFASLGYGDTILEGTQQTTATFSLTTPKAWQYNPGASVTVYIRNSALLNSASSVTVTVNGQPMVSHALSSRTAKGIILHVPFPSRLTGSTIVVGVEAEMFLTQESCATPTSSNAPDRYVVVSDRSAFHLPHAREVSATLAHFPDLYLSPTSQWTATTAVVPDNPSAALLTSLARIFVGYAPVTRGGYVTVTTARHVSLGPTGPRLWIIDMDGDNPLARRVERDHEVIIHDTRGGLSSPDLPLVYVVEQQGGAVEQAFVDRDRPLLVLTAPTPTALLATASWFAQGIPTGTEATSAALHTPSGTDIYLHVIAVPKLSFQQRLWNDVNNAYRVLLSGGGQTLIYLIMFASTLGTIAAYLGWIFFQGRTTRRKKPRLVAEPLPPPVPKPHRRHRRKKRSH